MTSIARGAVAFALGLLLSGCVTLSGKSKRVALAPVPGTPPSLRGAPGVGLTARVPFGPPRGGRGGDGIATPELQPEINGVFRFADRFYTMFDLNFGLGTQTRSARADLPIVSSDLSFGGLVGVGYDFQVTKGFGIQASGEFGFNIISITTTIMGFDAGVSNQMLFAGRLAVAPYVELGRFRMFAGAALGTDVYSDADGFGRVSCGGCGISDSARTETSGLGMVGVGARYQPHRIFAVGFELWVPLAITGVRHPAQAAISVALGNFDFVKSGRPATQPEDEFKPVPPPPMPAPLGTPRPPELLPPPPPPQL